MQVLRPQRLGEVRADEAGLLARLVRAHPMHPHRLHLAALNLPPLSSHLCRSLLKEPFTLYPKKSRMQRSRGLRSHRTLRPQSLTQFLGHLESLRPMPLLHFRINPRFLTVPKTFRLETHSQITTRMLNPSLCLVNWTLTPLEQIPLDPYPLAKPHDLSG